MSGTSFTAGTRCLCQRTHAEPTSEVSVSSVVCVVGESAVRWALCGSLQVRAQLSSVWQQCAPLLRSVQALELDGVVFLMLRSATVQRLSHHLQRMRSEGEIAANLHHHHGNDGAGQSPPPLWVKVDGDDAPRELHHVEVAAQLPHLHAFVRSLRETALSSDDTGAFKRVTSTAPIGALKPTMFTIWAMGNTPSCPSAWVSPQPKPPRAPQRTLEQSRALHREHCGAWLWHLVCRLQQSGRTAQGAPSVRRCSGSVGELGCPQPTTLLLAVFVLILRQLTPGSLAVLADASLQWQDMGTEGWGSATHIVPLPLPTLAGWLLEYPAVYVFNSQQGASAARNLSCCSLLLHRVRASCELITRLVSVAKGGGGGVPDSADGADIVLLSFSVPSELLPAASSGSECPACEQRGFSVRLDEGVRALVARMAQRAARSGAAAEECEQTRQVTQSEATAALSGELRWTAPRLDVEVRAPYVVAL